MPRQNGHLFGYTWDPDEDREMRGPPRDWKCSPEKLLAFIRRLGRVPTLAECKTEFGGILGAMMDYGTLRERGLTP